MSSRSRLYHRFSADPPYVGNNSGKDRIEVQYDDLQAFVKQFQFEGDDLTKLYFFTSAKLDALKREWIGLGSEKFFLEMDTIIMPSLDRLCKALIEAAHSTSKISRTYRTAEENLKLECSRIEG